MKRVYISGAISGLSKEEYEENFMAAIQIVTLAGFKAVSPLNLWHPVKCWLGYMIIDIIALCLCDCVYFMDNWKSSRGARAEYAVAMFLHKKIIQI